MNIYGHNGKVIVSRKWAMPNKDTFLIKPIAELISRYVPIGGKGWIDPFAGDNSPAEFTNDINPIKQARWHLHAVEFCNELTKDPSRWLYYDGVLFDPVYSPEQRT